MNPSDLKFYPLTEDHWYDFETLFEPHGAYGGCWCMWWRTTRVEFQRRQGEGNKRAMHEIVHADQVPGILAYYRGEPIGWCSVAPREQYPLLNRSPVLKRIDDTPVWSIVCFYIAKEYRGHGVLEELTRAAVDYVRTRGGTVVEAYPTVPQNAELPPVTSYMGTLSVFERVGFVQSARPSKSKVVLRYYIDNEDV